MIEAREFIDPDGSAWWRFRFAVDGCPGPHWEIPQTHRLRFRSEDEFEDYLGRTALQMNKEANSGETSQA